MKFSLSLSLNRKKNRENCQNCHFWEIYSKKKNQKKKHSQAKIQNDKIILIIQFLKKIILYNMFNKSTLE